MNPGWKSALIGSVMALGSDSALANKPLPCPTTGPLQDTIGVVQSGTREKIEDRLRAIDTEKRHQVVVVTVKSVEEYGYGSIEEMANAIGMKCKVGYRWENTGVVVLYTQIPSRYRIETAATERYLTDAQSKRMLAHSKSDGVCTKEDVSCRLNDVTWGIHKLIQKEFPDTQAVEQVQTAIKKHDEKKSSEQVSNFLNNLWIGAVIVVVLWSGTWGGMALKRNSRRKALKKEIFELGIRIQTEKQKYPKWFQDAYIQKIEDIVRGLSGYDDGTLDDMLSSKRAKTYASDMNVVRSALDSWESEYRNIESKLGSARTGLVQQRTKLAALEEGLRNEGFLFGSVDMPDIADGANPLETLSAIERASRIANSSIMDLGDIPRYYESIHGCASDLKKCLGNEKSRYQETFVRYADIFGSAVSVDVSAIEKRVVELAQSFYESYAQKNMPMLRSLDSGSKTVLSSLMWATKEMIQKLQWYDSLPSELSVRARKLQKMSPSPSYTRDAREYADKTGKREFLGYDMPHALVTLQGILATVTQSHSEKKNLSEVSGKLSQFDREYGRMEEYIWLGALLASIIAAEIAAAEAERRRKKREEEEAEERRHEQAAAQQRAAESSSSPSWSSGGGGWFSGGGATDD